MSQQVQTENLDRQELIDLAQQQTGDTDPETISEYILDRIVDGNIEDTQLQATTTNGCQWIQDNGYEAVVNTYDINNSHYIEEGEAKQSVRCYLYGQPTDCLGDQLSKEEMQAVSIAYEQQCYITDDGRVLEEPPDGGGRQPSFQVTNVSVELHPDPDIFDEPIDLGSDEALIGWSQFVDITVTNTGDYGIYNDTVTINGEPVPDTEFNEGIPGGSTETIRTSITPKTHGEYIISTTKTDITATFTIPPGFYQSTWGGLQIADVTINPETIGSGDSTTIELTAYNPNPQPFPQNIPENFQPSTPVSASEIDTQIKFLAPISVLLDVPIQTTPLGGTIPDFEIPQIPPGETQTIEIPWDSSGLDSVGTFGILFQMTNVQAPQKLFPDANTDAQVTVEPPEGELYVASLSVTPNNIEVGGEAEILVEIGNSKDIEDTFTGTVTLDGRTIEDIERQLQPGEETPVSILYTATLDDIGDNTVSIGGKEATLSVLEPPETSQTLTLTYSESVSGSPQRDIYIAFGSGDTLTNFSPQVDSARSIQLPDTGGGQGTVELFLSEDMTPDLLGEYDVLVAVSDTGGYVGGRPSRSGSDTETSIVETLTLQ